MIGTIQKSFHNCTARWRHVTRHTGPEMYCMCRTETQDAIRLGIMDQIMTFLGALLIGLGPIDHL